jgi:hypothetical protein
MANSEIQNCTEQYCNLALWHTVFVVKFTVGASYRYNSLLSWFAPEVTLPNSRKPDIRPSPGQSNSLLTDLQSGVAVVMMLSTY